MRPAPHLSVRIYIVLFIAFFSSGYAQFRGSAGLGLTTYRNAEGSDTSSADLAIIPELQLGYTFDLSPVTAFEAGVFTQYDLYLRKAERSYLTLSIDGQLRSYLSNTDAIRAEKSDAPAIDASRFQEIVTALTRLADSTLDLRTAVERTALKKDAILDIQSDVAATLVAYASLLGEMGLTQSFKEVLVDELTTIRSRVALLGVMPKELSRYQASVDSVTALVNASVAESDFSLSPGVPAEEPAQSMEDDTTSLASIITLVSTDHAMDNFSYARLYPKLYLAPASATTYATLLTVPLTLDRKKYRPDYATYSYFAWRLEPRLELYPSHTFGLGFNYLFENSKFRYEEQYSFTEHQLRLDMRLALGSAFCLVAEAGFGRRSYPDPMSVTIVVGQGGNQRTLTYTASHNYLRFSPGLALIAFPADNLSLGIAARITRNPNSDATYVGGISGQRVFSSSYFGLASDESYLYEANALAASLYALFPADIELGMDFIKEARTYPPPPPIRGLKTRQDDALWLVGSLSKYFLFGQPKLGFVTSLDPRITLTYTDLVSNLSEFSYSDLSIALAVSVGF